MFLEIQPIKTKSEEIENKQLTLVLQPEKNTKESKITGQYP